MQRTTHQLVQAVLDGAAGRVGLPPAQLGPGDALLVARRARHGAGASWRADPRDLAAALGLRVSAGGPPGCGGEGAAGDSVIYRWSPDRRERGLLLLHGIAHVLLRREAWEHGEADVWLVTLELAAPSVYLARVGAAEIARCAHAPEALVERWARAVAVRRAAA